MAATCKVLSLLLFFLIFTSLCHAKKEFYRNQGLSCFAYGHAESMLSVSKWSCNICICLDKKRWHSWPISFSSSLFSFFIMALPWACSHTSSLNLSEVWLLQWVMASLWFDISLVQFRLGPWVLPHCIFSWCLHECKNDHHPNQPLTPNSHHHPVFFTPNGGSRLN